MASEHYLSRNGAALVSCPRVVKKLMRLHVRSI